MNSLLVLFGLNLSPLLAAMAQVESENGRTSANVYQLTPVYVADVNRIRCLRRETEVLNFRRVAFSREFSEAAILTYWAYYGNLFATCYARRVDYEYLARIHNGGPDGWRKSETKPYWQKVRAALERHD